MRDASFTANARVMGSRQAAATGPLDLPVWTALQTGGTLSVLEPSRLGAAGYAVPTGSQWAGTNLYIGRAQGGNGGDLRPANATYHPRLHV